MTARGVCLAVNEDDSTLPIEHCQSASTGIWLMLHNYMPIAMQHALALFRCCDAAMLLMKPDVSLPNVTLLFQAPDLARWAVVDGAQYIAYHHALGHQRITKPA
jgi:hypothetical protein